MSIHFDISFISSRGACAQISKIEPPVYDFKRRGEIEGFTREKSHVLEFFFILVGFFVLDIRLGFNIRV